MENKFVIIIKDLTKKFPIGGDFFVALKTALLSLGVPPKCVTTVTLPRFRLRATRRDRMCTCFLIGLLNDCWFGGFQAHLSSILWDFKSEI